MDRHDRNADIVSGELEYLERKIPLAIGEEREKLVRSRLDHIAEDRKLCAAKVDAAEAMVHIDQVMAWQLAVENSFAKLSQVQKDDFLSEVRKYRSVRQIIGKVDGTQF